MKLRILSVFLIFLLVTSIVVTPATAKFVVDGVIITAPVIVEIGKHLGMAWDGITEHFHNFADDVTKSLNNLFSAKKWVDITSGKGKAVMAAVYEGYTSPSGSGGKKDDKWYFAARKNHGKIEINTERKYPDNYEPVKPEGCYMFHVERYQFGAYLYENKVEATMNCYIYDDLQEWRKPRNLITDAHVVTFWRDVEYFEKHAEAEREELKNPFSPEQARRKETGVIDTLYHVTGWNKVHSCLTHHRKQKDTVSGVIPQPRRKDTLLSELIYLVFLSYEYDYPYP